MVHIKFAVLLSVMLLIASAQEHHQQQQQQQQQPQHYHQYHQYEPQQQQQQHHHHQHQLPPVEYDTEEHFHAHPKYEFKYGVKDEHTHDIKEQHEKRDGDKVEGHYMLHEADGTIRTVRYTADKHTGFHAEVERSGHAVHPVHHQEEKVEIPQHHEKGESSQHHQQFAVPQYQHTGIPAQGYANHAPAYAPSNYNHPQRYH